MKKTDSDSGLSIIGELVAYVFSAVFVVCLFFIVIGSALWLWNRLTYPLKVRKEQIVSCQKYYEETRKGYEYLTEKILEERGQSIAILQAKLDVYENTWRKLGLEK